MPSSVTFGQSYEVPVTVKDASGNPVLNLNQNAFDIHLQGQEGVYDAQGTVSALGNGQYQVTFFAPGTMSTSDINSMRNGTYLATMLVNGVQVGSAQSVNITSANYSAQAQPNNAPNIGLNFPQNLIANDGTASVYPMQIHVTDANGNPVVNQQVSLSSNNTNIASPASTMVTTDANGNANVGMTPGFMPGTATITAMSGTSTQTIQVQTIAMPQSITLSAQSLTIIENAAAPTATVTVLNADGTPASGVALNVSADSPNPSDPNESIGLSVPQSDIVTDANGQATFTLPNTGIGGNTVNVEVGDNALQSNTLTYTVDSPDIQQSTVTSFPAILTLDTPYTASVHVADASGNPLLGLNNSAFVLEDLVGDWLTASSVSDQGNGNYTVTFNTPSSLAFSGDQTMNFLVNGVQIGSQTMNIS